MENKTLNTSYQAIHDGSTFAFIRSTAAVLLADSASPAAGDVATAAADTYVPLPIGKTTYAKVASSTAAVQIFK